MLWFLRKAFGIIALVWIVAWLVSMASCFVDPKLAGHMIAGMLLATLWEFPQASFGSYSRLSAC